MNKSATTMRQPSKKQKNELAALAALRHAQIDLSDAPQVKDWRRAAVGKFYRPPEKRSSSRRPTR